MMVSLKDKGKIGKAALLAAGEFGLVVFTAPAPNPILLTRFLLGEME